MRGIAFRVAPLRRLTPFLLLGVLTLGTGLGVGLGLSEAPRSTVARTAAPAVTPQVRAVVPPATLETTPTTTVETPSSTPASGVQPEHPYGLAAGPNGTLYILDTGRDQILQLMASGTFQVVAGTGQSGFSGDGGPAIDADLNLTAQSGIVVTSSGALFFSDSGNDRVREVDPDGTITTVAGGGTVTLGTAPVPALQASFGPGPAGLTIGPDGDLYIGANAVYQLMGDGVLQWVVGIPPNVLPPPPGWSGVYGNPGAQTDFVPANRLAFDGAGDLLVAGGGGFGLYEDTAAGTLFFLENFRGDGTWGSMAPSPGGGVVLCARGGLSIFQPSGTITPIPADLSAALGLMTGPESTTPTGSVLQNTFIGGDGVAVAPDRAIYVDTNTGNTFTSVSALIEVGGSGSSPTVLWKS
jgi:hypothetical protein